MLRLLTLITALLSVAGNALAQGDGPRTNFLMPVGFDSLAITYVQLDSNYRFGQSEAPGNTDIETNSAVASWASRFNLKGRFSQVSVTAGVTTIKARARIPGVLAEEIGRDVLSVTRTGMTDPRVTYRVGVYGAPALTPPEWQEYESGFQLYAQAGLSVPVGNYNPAYRLNPGRNRWSWDIRMPMVIPIDGARRRTFLEISPTIAWFGVNDDPFGPAMRSTQDPLYQLEAHVMHEMTNKWWISAGFFYQNGGRTYDDGQPLDNKVNQFIGELAFGYVHNRNIALLGSVGKIFEAKTNARGEMWRLRVLFAF